MKKDPRIIIRLAWQSLFLLLGGLSVYFIYRGWIASAHALCPYAIVCFGARNAGFIKITSALFAYAIVGGFAICIISMFIGRKFCGYICPLGSIQEAVYKFHQKRCYRKNRFPFYLERKLGKLKYLVLIVNVLAVALGGAVLYMRFCPVMALSALSRIGIAGAVILGLVALGGFFVERFWCRFFCPYAALLNVFQQVGDLFGIKRSLVMRNLEKCNECGVCASYCPMNINIMEAETVVDVNCIHCDMCALACPKKGMSKT